MSAPTIIVAGQGRCGTSLVMQMLSVAGVPTVGTWPDFEDTGVAASLAHDPARWAAASQGRAVKVLEPQRAAPPVGGDYRAIWLSRDFEQQARSVLKLVGASTSRRSRRAMERSLRADDGPAQRALRQACTVPGAEPRIVSLTFEQILWDPRTVSLALCAFLALDIPDAGAIDAMANCVVPRTPECLPGFLEAELILSGQAGAGKLH